MARANNYSSSSTATYPSKGTSKSEFKEETTKPAVVDIKGKAKFESSQPVRSRDVKCFKCLGYGHIASQCPNKQVKIIRDAIEDIISESESDPIVEEEEGLVVHLEEGELLVIH